MSKFIIKAKENLSKNRWTYLFLLTSLLLLFYNVTLRSKDAKKENILDNNISKMQLAIMIDTTEGKTIPNTILQDSHKKNCSLIEQIAKRNYSIIILEPLSPCNTCLDTTLNSWVNYSFHFPSLRNINFFVISSGDSRRALFLLHKINLPNAYFSDKNGVIFSGLGLNFIKNTIALLVNKNMKIIYIEALHWKYPEKFIRFMQKSNQFLTNNL